MIINAQLQPASISLREAFGKALVSLGEKYPELVVLDVDLSSSTKTDNFAQHFPNRFFNIGIAEQNMTGIAMGMAAVGKIPIISGFTCFIIGRAWEFIRAAAYDHLSLKICTTHAGLSPDLDGGSHQALEDLALMATIPGVHIFCPADPAEIQPILQKMMETPGVCYLRLMRNALPWIYSPEKQFTQSGQLKQSTQSNLDLPPMILQPQVLYESELTGTDIYDISLMMTGSITAYFPAIIRLIEQHNRSCRVIHFPCIKPFDSQLVHKFCSQTKAIITIEEHNITAGFGAQLGRVISENSISSPIPILHLGIQDLFGQTGTLDQLYHEYHIDPTSIVNDILNWLKNNNSIE